jgi:ABC-type lipoprotein release transport system permease subunit
MASKGMWRMIGRQVRSRRDRSIALGAGILVASVSFSLLTAAASTSQLEVHGTVDAAARPAYDILVRPKGAADAIETQDNLVRDNYLADTFGGITLAQWHEIEALRGVSIAAPIANIGYMVLEATIAIPIGAAITSATHQLYRVSITWKAANGATSYPGGVDYVYYTPTDSFATLPTPAFQYAADFGEKVPGDSALVPVCANMPGNFPSGPLDSGAGGTIDCFSSKTPLIGSSGDLGVGPQPGAVVAFSFPVLLSAVDPVEEAKLVGLDHTIVAGQYLSELHGLITPLPAAPGNVVGDELPVITSSRTFLDESLTATVQRLMPAAGIDVPTELANLNSVGSFLSGLNGPPVGVRTLTAQAAYAAALHQLMNPPKNVSRSPGQGGGAGTSVYFTTSKVQYRDEDGTLAAIPTSNSASQWTNPFGGQPPFAIAPPGNQDVQYRQLTAHDGNPIVSPTTEQEGVVGLAVVGQFDPDKLPGFNPLSAVPLETYYPPIVTGATAASRNALHNQPLGPTMNLGGYVAQPPLLLTSLTAMEQMLSSSCYLNLAGLPCTRYANTDIAAPISAIRVRVSDVYGFEPIDRARVLAVATAIKKATGLQVDITAGSSPTTVDVSLQAGCCGQPALTVAEGWVRKGAALVVLNAVDAKSLVLFVLVLAVCVLFLANGAYASVRSRRTELGVLACLGWGRAALFRLVLGELALVGLATGVIGAALAEILALALRLDLPWWHALLVVPIALGLACVAGLAPAYAATRGRPLDAVYSVPGGGGRHRAVRHVSGIARANLLRRPARLVSGALGLFIGVAAFAVLLAVQLAFQGQVVGTALGNVVSVQVRSVDLIAAVLALLLGAFSVADVLAVNLRDRAGEQAVLAATGWRPATLFRLAFTEGMVVGLVGAIAGGAVGLGLAAILTGSATAVIPASVLAAVIGLFLVGAVLMVPAWQASQTVPAAALAED